MNTLYDGAADIGYMRAYSGIIVAIIVAISLSCGAFYFLTTSDPHTISIDAIISTSNVITNSKGKNTYSNIYTYTVNNNIYTGTINESTQRSVNSTISIKYDPKNPSSSETSNTPSHSTFGSISLCVASLLPLIAFINYYLTSNFKPYAALSGAEGVYDVLKN
jgi:hypothetical protein